tara:strand:- start:105 stop:209 length:105 start_codon:yes stop_codon:yes gene_type:complete
VPNQVLFINEYLVVREKKVNGVFLMFLTLIRKFL